MSEAILRVTEAAVRKLESLRVAQSLDDAAVRITVCEDGAAFRYDFEFVDADDADAGDSRVDAGGTRILIDEDSAPRLAGATLDFVEDLEQQGFRIDNPNAPALLRDPLAARVQELLDARINPEVAQHGGHVSLAAVHEGRVYLRFGGGCQGCGMVDVTLKEGVEKVLREAIPELLEVVDHTDHAAGSNPYYQRD